VWGVSGEGLKLVWPRIKHGCRKDVSIKKAGTEENRNGKPSEAWNQYGKIQKTTAIPRHRDGRVWEDCTEGEPKAAFLRAESMTGLKI
jgi:hypothetical protein